MCEAAELIGYAAVQAPVETQVAGRAGLSVGGLRVLLRVAALRESGVRIRAADVLAARAAAATETRRNLRGLLASGHLERTGGPVRGHLSLTLAGRKVLGEFTRGLERARQQLVRFEPCPPFRRTTPRKTRGLELPSNDSGND